MKNFSKHSTRTWLLMAATGVFLFTSCTDDIAQDESINQPESQQKLLTLAPIPDEPILIEDLTSDEIQIAKGRATDAAGDDRGRFNISLKFVLPPTDRQREVFEEAAARWERIIIKDVPSFTGTLPSAIDGLPPVVQNETVDDIIIEVVLAPIDGPGQILGQAGPRFVRLSDFLTISGIMFFDVADLASLENVGLFDEVIVHEMGHVLGIGTLWNVNVPELGIERNLLQGTFESPFFAGRKANVFWNAEGGADNLPIENEFGPGTRFGHWKEASLDNELMTGFLNPGENPLSRITAGSMKDLGYGAASVGESYDLPRGTEGVDPSTLGLENAEGVNIAEKEILLQPIGFITSSKK